MTKEGQPLPTIQMGENKDHKMHYAVPALAALAFITTVIDDQPIADLIPDTLSNGTLQSGLEISQQQMVDYFGNFVRGAEGADMLDLALASVALPTIYNKAKDTFSEQQRSTNKKDENKFTKLGPKMPLNFNLTKDLSNEVKNFLSDDFNKPQGPLPLPAKVPAGFGFHKPGGIRMNNDGNFAGDSILEHSDRNIIHPN